MYKILKNIIEMDDYSVQKLSNQPPEPFEWNTVEETELNVSDCIGGKGKIAVKGNTYQKQLSGEQPSPSPDYPQDIKVVTESNIIHHSNGINNFSDKEYAESNSDYFSYDEQDGLSLKKQDTRAMDKVGMNFEVESNKEYCIKFNNTCSIMIAEYTSAGKWRRNTRLNAGNTFTTQSTTAYIKVKFDRLDGIAYPVLIGNVSISQNDDYKEEKYQLSLGNIEVCKIGDYEDTIFKNIEESKYYNKELEEGAWYINRVIGKAVIDGSKNIGFSQQTNNVFYTSTTITDISIVDNNIPVCDYYKGENLVHTAAQASDKGNYAIMFKDYDSVMYIVDNRFSNIADLKQWLSDNNITVYYVSKELTYKQITNPTLISQLEALRKAKWYKGVNHWWTETNNLEPVLKGTYRQAINE